MNGMHRLNGECAYCAEGTRYDHNSGTCKTICGKNAFYEKHYRSCVCDAGYYLIDSHCQTCGKN